MKITKQVLDDMIHTIGSIEAETGGILGSKNNIICSFYFDKNAFRYHQKYCPDIDDFNLKLAEWGRDGILFAGIAHSHPNGYIQLSYADRESIRSIVKSVPHLPQLYFPIITKSNGIVVMTAYRAKIKCDRVSIKKITYDVL